MNMQEAGMLLHYNQWAHERVWTCVDTLTDEQFVQDVGYAFDSIRGQLVHVMRVDARWFARIAGTELPPLLNAEDFADRAAVRAKWDEIYEDARVVARGLTDEMLARTIEFDMPHRGGMKRATIAQIISHVVNHGTDHRAQILSMLHGLGAPTVEQDMMFYVWEQNEKSS